MEQLMQLIHLMKKYFSFSGACACIELEGYNDAISWCREGLAVSFGCQVHNLMPLHSTDHKATEGS